MPETVGQRLRMARKKKEWTQNKLSEVSGVGRNSICFYERECVDPSFFNITCIADALDVSLDWLAGRKENMGV